MNRLLVNAPDGSQQVVEGVGYFDPARVLWDERADGPLPPVTLGAMVRVNGALEVDQTALATLGARTFADAKTATLTRLASLAKAKLEGGTIINGLTISTSADAKGMLALGKIGNKASRKVVTSSGQKAVLTAAEFDGLVAAVDTFGQAVMDRHYDLIGAIDASTTMTELQAIDITTGWPA